MDTDDQQIRIAQLQRNARNKGKSKLMHKFKGLGEGEDKEAKLRFKRLGDALRSILKLHNPVELSSICGNLGLPTQERGSTSLENIIAFCIEKNEFSEGKIIQMISATWEGALFEYLKSVGYPMISSFADPKLAVMKYLRKGLIAEGITPFTPHYVCKRVAPRYDWIQSQDIAPKLVKLREIETVVKKTEKEVMAEDDFNNVLAYMQKMHELRRLENEYRDYASNELEIARSKLDRAESNEKMAQEMLIDMEHRYITVSKDLNRELAHRESIGETLATEKIMLEGQLRRLRKVIYSCKTSTAARCEGRTPLDPPNIVAVSVMDDIDECDHAVRNLHHDILSFKEVANQTDDELRTFILKQANEIKVLNEKIEGLKYDVSLADQRARIAVEREKNAILEVNSCAKDILRREQMADATRKVTWDTSVRWANRAQGMEEKLRKFAPAIKSAIFAGDEGAIVFALALNKAFGIVANSDISQWQETFVMEKEDALSLALREEFRAKIRKANADKVKAKGTGKAAGKSKKAESSPGPKKKGSSKSPGPSKKKSASPAPNKGGSKSPAKKKK
jgi:hypothetical protein